MESDEVLDNTWVHPENYDLAREISSALKEGKPSKEQISSLAAKYNTGAGTVEDIISELQKPARDPREDYPGPIMQKGVQTFEDLKTGMTVTGKIKNVVDFGAFVDLGIKETALLHLSEMSDTYVEHPMDVVKAGDIVTAKIIDMDEKRRRIALSMKTGAPQTREKRENREPRETGGKTGRKEFTGNKTPKNNSKTFVKKNDSGAITHNPFAALLNKK